MSTQTYRVEGMTCGHCAAAVTREVAAIDGVTDVTVDVDAGTVSFQGEPEEQALAAAVDEAGYTLLGRS